MLDNSTSNLGHVPFHLAKLVVVADRYFAWGLKYAAYLYLARLPRDYDDTKDSAKLYDHQLVNDLVDYTYSLRSKVLSSGT